MKKLFLLPILFICFSMPAHSQSKIKVACVGNSITQGPGRDNPDSYPLQMQEMLGDAYEVRNFGVSGRTLLKKGDYPYWNEPQFEEVIAFAPDILVIKLGTNDSKPQNWRYKEEFKSDLLEMVKTFKKSMTKKGKVYLCIPVPVFQGNYDINEQILVNEMRPLILQVAKRTKAKVIDLYTPLEDKPALLPDGVHPNKAGLGIMAATVASHIKQ